MMEVIVVDLMSTHWFVLTVYAIQKTVMVQRNSYQMVTATMKPTMQTATMMEVTVVEHVPTQTIVQIVSVMQSLRLIPIVSKHLWFILGCQSPLLLSLIASFYLLHCTQPLWNNYHFYSQNRICIKNYNFWPKYHCEKRYSNIYFEIPPLLMK